MRPLNKTDIVSYVSNVVDSIMCIHGVPTSEIAKYIIGGDDIVSIRMFVKTFLSMRQTHKRANNMKKNKLHLLLSVLKMTGMFVFDIAVFRENATEGFVYIKNGKSHAFACNVCGKNIAKNNRGKHRDKCPDVERCGICEKCGMVVDLHPYAGKEDMKLKFCPIDNIICNYCEENMTKSEYYIFHAENCGNKLDAKCMWCHKVFPRREICIHVLDCEKIGDHMKICKTGIVGDGYKSMIQHNEICRTYWGNEIGAFICKWKNKVINHYLNTYKNVLLPYFKASLNDRRKYGNLCMLGIITDQPGLMGDDPVMVESIVGDGIDDFDDTYCSLKNFGFLESDVLFEQIGTYKSVATKGLFRLEIRTYTFAFWIVCELLISDNKHAEILLRHVPARYNDEDLDYYMQDAILKGYFGMMKLSLNIDGGTK